MKFKLSAYTIYELGQRKRQEDSIFPLHNATQSDDRLFIVCDGMGGHSGGNIASAAVCEAMSNTLLSICPEAEGRFSDDDLRQALEAAYDSLDAKDDGSEKKMGTTMTLLKFHDAGCTIAHIGDSRVYHVRPGADAAATEILFQTQDHSLVNDLVRIGELTPEEAKTSKQRNIITRAMQPNMGRRSRADIYHTTDIRPGDYFMLCTDGILEQMEDDNIKYIFSDKVGDAQQKVDMIVKVTADNSDNHSAILVKVTDVKGAPVVATPEHDLHQTVESAEEKHESKNRRTQLAYILGMCAIVLATILFLTLRSSDDAPKSNTAKATVDLPIDDKTSKEVDDNRLDVNNLPDTNGQSSDGKAYVSDDVDGLNDADNNLGKEPFQKEKPSELEDGVVDTQTQPQITTQLEDAEVKAVDTDTTVVTDSNEVDNTSNDLPPVSHQDESDSKEVREDEVSKTNAIDE